MSYFLKPMVYSDFTRQEYSEQDFMRLLEHRIRKDLRAMGSLNPQEEYAIDEPTSARGKILTHFLESIFQGRLKLTGDRTLFTNDMESFLSSRLDVFMQGRDPSLFSTPQLHPLRSITQHELQEAANILDIKEPLSLTSNSFIEALHEKYPQTKQSFLKSFQHIQEQSEKLTKK